MAAPIIDSIIASPNTVSPGSAFVVTIAAHDPDQRTGLLTGVVRDVAGVEARATALVSISDPLSFQLLDEGGVGFVVTARAGSPGVFDCRAP